MPAKPDIYSRYGQCAAGHAKVVFGDDAVPVSAGHGQAALTVYRQVTTGENGRVRQALGAVRKSVIIRTVREIVARSGGQREKYFVGAVDKQSGAVWISERKTAEHQLNFVGVRGRDRHRARRARAAEKIGARGVNGQRRAFGTGSRPVHGHRFLGKHHPCGGFFVIRAVFVPA